MEASETDETLPAFVAAQVRAVAGDVRQREAPLTTWLVVLLTLLFAQQVVAAQLAGVRIQDVAGHLFVEHTAAAWLLSFFLHRNLLHFGTNVALILLLGRVVEATVAEREFLLLVVAAAVASVLGGIAFTATFTPRPVAVYGASGLGFALATYSLALPLGSATPLRSTYRPEHLFETLSPAEELALLVGAAAALHVAVDLVTGPYLTMHWVNGGHAVGALVGLLFGLALRERSS